MKTILALFGLFTAAYALGQGPDQFEAFNLQKKKTTLTTGITMSYVERGNIGGASLILLHGCTDTGRSFQLLIDELVSVYPNLRIIAPDLRGHGDSSMPDRRTCASTPENCFTPAVLAADVLALMDQMEIQSAYIVGHSMGSVVAQELALNFPERVNRMVLIGSMVYGKENSFINDFLISGLIEKSWRPILETESDFSWPEDAYFITPESLGDETTSFLRKNWVNEPGTEEAFLDAILRETIQVPVGTWIGGITALGKTDNRNALQNLKVPTLILWAAQDTVFPLADQKLVISSLEKAAQVNGTPVIYKTYGKESLPANGSQESDLGHNLQWAAPKQIAGDIIAFVRNGFPRIDLPYLNPENYNEVLVEQGRANIMDGRIHDTQALNTDKEH
ncbi:MAG TPA: alpha/beta hydrolase [Cyclobacteriaceae bacterium]